ncbi:hypothetical protein H1C71_004954, partial [Ictidomys tridecemlineatus]
APGLSCKDRDISVPPSLGQSHLKYSQVPLPREQLPSHAGEGGSWAIPADNCPACPPAYSARTLSSLCTPPSGVSSRHPLPRSPYPTPSATAPAPPSLPPSCFGAPPPILPSQYLSNKSSSASRDHPVRSGIDTRSA